MKLLCGQSINGGVLNCLRWYRERDCFITIATTLPDNLPQITLSPSLYTYMNISPYIPPSMKHAIHIHIYMIPENNPNQSIVVLT